MKTFFRKPLPYRQGRAVFYIIGINVFIFVLTSILPGLTYLLALSPRGVMSGYLWQLFTYMFAHGGIMHILFNMLALFFFARSLEARLGTPEFLLFYFICGIGSGLITTLFYLLSGYNIYLIGASGAVYGVLLAFATEFPNARIFIFGIIPVKAPFLVLGFAVLEVINQISLRGSSNVAHLAHLAGFAIAYFYYVVRLGVNPFSVFFGKNNRQYWE